ncbi:hypothetical protein AA101099_2161 [Neoasaia chiangmaiensis NBRC 101099]|uniref:Uncharacterized protein n=1 Tax=Neoasaia chiangmaiensis TaxID=320497 RepID=A0A1U9KSV2_9PROT|nr:hypothetical protein [Neoasaia chiangmaiensis]AQS88865.1 hypothetical protein A0U93_14115 [Neoasaia chiangmaiensis]GBR40540.1 hypothetical protein AA101099_2161 [Neoasaia chiangmaiensis NBRC 101099]GEN13851.1 hypothetical protein NCH01_02820 [Neoasaia chiangmaiensis]
MSSSQTTNDASRQHRALDAAYGRALAFRLPDLALRPAQALAFAEHEARAQRIAVDVDGLTGPMRHELLQPGREAAQEWLRLRDDFEIALQPKRADLDAVARLDAQIAQERADMAAELDGAEREWRKNPRYEQIDDHHSRSRHLFDEFRDKHRNRNAIMFALNPFYWLLMALVLVTECFINYHAFNQFWGVPAVAFGSTVVLGVLLALAAHEHGKLLKQWSFRFGMQREPMARRTDWRLFGLSSGALFLVLAFTGWARWAAALQAIGAQAQTSALGDIGVVAVHPLRDVMISLIANLGAWMVSVILSYNAHDADPDYMHATSQYRVARRRWNRARGKLLEQLRHVQARHEKSIAEKVQSAETRRRGVTRELDMLEQVRARGAAIERDTTAAMHRNLYVYRDALLRLGRESHGSIAFINVATQAPISLNEFGAMPLTTPPLFLSAASF